MFAKYFEVRLAWLFLFILSVLSAFGAIWIAYFNQDWRAIGLAFFFMLMIFVLQAGITEQKTKPSDLYASRNK